MIGIFPYKTEVELRTIPTQTFLFIFICSLVHLITWLISKKPSALEEWFYITGFLPQYLPSAWIHIFVHSDFSHLFTNMFFLFLFGAPLELTEGKRKS